MEISRTFLVPMESMPFVLLSMLMLTAGCRDVVGSSTSAQGEHLVTAPVDYFAMCFCLLTCDSRSTLHELRCGNVFVGQGPPHLGVMRNAFTETLRSLFGSLLRRVHLVEPKKNPTFNLKKTLLSALPVREASGDADCPDPSGSFRPNANIGKSSAGHLGTLHHVGSRQRPWPSKKLASSQFTSCYDSKVPEESTQSGG